MVSAGPGVVEVVSKDERALFAERGWLAFPGALDAEEVEVLRAGVDAHVDAATPTPAWREAALRRIVVRPGTLAVVDALLGPAYAFHHVHAARFGPGAPGIAWHHDYEQYPQTNRSHGMLHVFYYLNGLTGTVGDLLVQPGSHRSVMDKGAFWEFGTQELPGTVRFDDLPPGSMVVVHSAVIHARDPRPGGTVDRYFVDVSYCQAGVRWPSYGPGWASMLAEFDAELHDQARPGLFDASAFFDVVGAWEAVKDLRGSLVHELGLLGPPS